MAKSSFTQGDQPMNFNNAIFLHINRIMESPSDKDYIERIHRFTILLYYYAKSDPELFHRIEESHIQPMGNTPYDNSMSRKDMMIMADKRLELMMEVIHSTGSILPIRQIEGILDEAVIDALDE